MIIGFIFVNLLMVCVAWVMAARLTSHHSLAEVWLTTFLFYITQISLTVLFLGLIIKDLGPIKLVLLNAVVSLVLLLWQRSRLRSTIMESLNALKAFFKWLVMSRDYVLWFFLLLLFGQIFATLVKIYFLPPFVGDVFSYHLHPVVDWFQEGRILSYTDTPVLRTMENPLGAKFLHFWWLRLVGDIRWIELPQFLFGLMLLVTVYVLLRRLPLQRNTALRYAIVSYFMPTVLLQSRTCQDHLIFASCIFLTLYYLIDVFFLGEEKKLIPLSLALGMLFSIKKHAVVVFVAFFLGLLLSRGFNHRLVRDFIKKNATRVVIALCIIVGYGSYFLLARQSLYQWLWQRYLGNPGALLNKWPIGVFILFLLMTWWILKKWQFAPFFKKKKFFLYLLGAILMIATSVMIYQNRTFLRPFLTGTTSPAMATNRNFNQQYPAFTHNFCRNVLVFPFRVRDIGLYNGYSPDLLEQSGFGPQFFAFGLLAYFLLIPLCLVKKEYRTSILGFLVLFSIVLLVIYFYFYFSWANYRSFLFFGVIGIIGWGSVAEKLVLKKASSFYLDVLVGIMLLFCAGACFFEGNMSAARWKTVFTMEHAIDRTSTQYASLMDTAKEKRSWEYIDLYIPADESIAFSGGGAVWVFPYFDFQLKRRIYFLKHLPGFATQPCQTAGGIHQVLILSEDLLLSLKQRGIHYLHLPTEFTNIKDEVYMPETAHNIVQVSKHLYYVKW